MATYFSVDEAARYLKISIIELLELEKCGDINAFAGNDGQWYFTKGVLDEYLSQNNTEASGYYIHEDYTNGILNIPQTPRVKVRHAFPNKHNHVKVTLDIEADTPTETNLDIKTNTDNSTVAVNDVTASEKSRLDKLSKYFTYFLISFLVFDLVMFIFYLVLTSR